MSASPRLASAKDAGPPSEGGYLIAKAHQIGGRVFNRLLKEAGGMDINPSQGRILFALWKKKRMRIAELARETALEPSTLTSMLDRLEAADLAVRNPSKEDRRALVVECTAAGRALMSRYSSASEKMTELFYDGMKTEEIADFESSLKRIVENLSRAEDQDSE